MATEITHHEVEDVATDIAEAVGSRVFELFGHDTAEYQRFRDQYRELAQQAIAIRKAEPKQS